jgi:hypothetical protein
MGCLLGIFTARSDTGTALSARVSFSPCVSFVPPWLSIRMYHLGRGTNNWPTGGRSSETLSHSIEMNNNIGC